MFHWVPNGDANGSDAIQFRDMWPGKQCVCLLDSVGFREATGDDGLLISMVFRYLAGYQANTTSWARVGDHKNGQPSVSRLYIVTKR